MLKNSLSYLGKMILQDDGKDTHKHVLYLVNSDVERSVYRTYTSLLSDGNNSSTHWNGSGDDSESLRQKNLKLVLEKELVYLNDSVFCSG